MSCWKGGQFGGKADIGVCAGRLHVATSLCPVAQDLLQLLKVGSKEFPPPKHVLELAGWWSWELAQGCF